MTHYSVEDLGITQTLPNLRVFSPADPFMVRAVIARTIKGKGVPFMEDELVWHYYIVTEEIREQALEALR